MDDKDTAPTSTQGDGENPIPTERDSVAALKRRVAELETALSKMTKQREETRRMLFELHTIALPEDRPPTEEELIEERKTLTEKSISQLIAELESDLGATES
jgi:hypothetical protein